jgi:hypothetical protein
VTLRDLTATHLQSNGRKKIPQELDSATKANIARVTAVAKISGK